LQQNKSEIVRKIRQAVRPSFSALGILLEGDDATKEGKAVHFKKQLNLKERPNVVTTQAKCTCSVTLSKVKFLNESS
jgi:hypothetical protein